MRLTRPAEGSQSGLSPTVRNFAAEADMRLVVVMVVSAALRLWLIFHGGQFFWPDEQQYRGARVLLAGLLGNAAALHAVLLEPSALMLRVVGLLPAGIEALTGSNPRVPAMVYGSCSLITIYVIAAIVRRLGGTRDESFFAALLAAGSTSLLYMSRHLTSYDLALMVGTLGLFTGVRRPAPLSSSGLTGILAATTFLAYAGAWPLAGAICVIHVIDAPTVRDATSRAMLTIVGLLGVVVVMTLVYRMAGESWIGRLSAFAGTITQGEYSEGWSLPFAYLWSAEHLLLVLWIAAVAWCLCHPRWTVIGRLPRAGIAGAFCVYGAIAISSTLLHRFVVYGRLVRPLVPFLCLTSAGVLGVLLTRVSGRRRWAVQAAFVVALVLQAGVNFRVPLRQVFPVDFVRQVERDYPEPRVFLDARHLYPGPETVNIPPGYREIAAEHHPLEFQPYLYEGYTERERNTLRTTDIRMRAFVPGR